MFGRIGFLSCAVVVVVFLATVAAVGASSSSAAPMQDPCDDGCPTSQALGAGMEGDSGAGEGTFPCMMSPRCGGAQAHAHGSSGLVGSMAAPFMVAEPAALAAEPAPSPVRPPDRLTVGAETPPPRTS